MWPFGKKKEKLKNNKTTEVPYSLEELRRKYMKTSCPRKDCICYTCPARGKCVVELEMKDSGACHMDGPMVPRIKECTIDKVRKGELDGTTKEGKPGGVIFVDNLDDPSLRCFEEGPTVRG